jgi:hypothetical protein
MRPVSVGDHEFAAVIFVGRGEKQSGREIGADPVRGAGNRPNCTIDMGPVIATENRS